MLSTGLLERRFTRRNGMRLAVSAAFAQFARANDAQNADFAHRIPARPENALTGSQFAEFVSTMDRQEREQAILDQLAQGNLPAFLRKVVPVKLRSGAAAATIFVTPEYLAIGSDDDFLRIPMNLHSAVFIANRFGFVLPTRKIVDAIYDQSNFRFTPQPLPAGPQMTSTCYYQMHNRMIEEQARSRDFRDGALVAGHKKDVVLTNRLTRMAGRIAIYGWHRAPGMPIQPLSTVHGAGYADYSHGIRLVAAQALVDGRMRSVRDLLENSALATALSYEGTIPVSSIFARA